MCFVDFSFICFSYILNIYLNIIDIFNIDYTQFELLTLKIRIKIKTKNKNKKVSYGVENTKNLC